MITILDKPQRIKFKQHNLDHGVRPNQSTSSKLRYRNPLHYNGMDYNRITRRSREHLVSNPLFGSQENERNPWDFLRIKPNP